MCSSNQEGVVADFASSTHLCVESREEGVINLDNLNRKELSALCELRVKEEMMHAKPHT